MTPLLAAALTLHVALAAGGPLRLASDGTGDAPVAWSLDGSPVATTADGAAAAIDAAPGPHELAAQSSAQGRWVALARPDTSAPGTAGLAPASVAIHEAPPAASHSRVAGAFLLCALAAALWPRRSLLQVPGREPPA